METIKAINADLSQYPAFKWCDDKGSGWYLPTANELIKLYDAWNPNRNGFNQILTAAGGNIIAATNNEIYWLSEESDINNTNTKVFVFDLNNAGSSVVNYSSKNMNFFTRAVRKF